MNQVEHVLGRSHTVKQLIEHLEGLDPDARVLFTCNYGDYSQTQQALPITTIEEYESSDLRESAYSHSGVSFTGLIEPSEPDKDDDETETVVILQFN